MFFIYQPDATPVRYDPEEAFLEYQRRQYIKQLQEEKLRRALFDRELQLEQERHRAALAQIAENERRRRRQIEQFQAQQEAQARAEAANRYAHQQQQRQYARYPTQGMSYESQRPTPKEILARRLARQQEEERRSRQFHQNILSNIFGVPVEEFDQSKDEDNEEEEEPQTEEVCYHHSKAIPRGLTYVLQQPTLAQLINEFSKRQQLPELSPPVRKDSIPQPIPASLSTSHQPEPIPVAAPEKPAESITEMETEEPLPEPESDAHWSSAPERARSLAQITAIERTFNCLKSTFVFPSGPLERLSSTGAPRLAYNSTNAPIHAYEHGLTDLLTKLDSVESYGFKGIREARKQLVVKIEEELGNLEKKITEGFTESGNVAAAPVGTSVSVELTEPKETSVPMDISETPAATAPTPLSVEPVQVMSTPTPSIEPVVSAEASTGPIPSLPSEPVEAMTIPTPVVQPVKDASKPDISDTTTAPIDAHKASISSTKIEERIPLPETMSDEELEIDDAIHIDITDDESSPTKNEHKSAVGEFEML